MPRAREDRLFERFRRRGDGRALAAVFDRVAPVLWRIAVRLAPDRHAAEDAVQGTFLAAIEDAAAWRADRPLLPWLLGILTNQVRQQRRREARQVEGQRLPAAPSDDPAGSAEGNELRDALAAALHAVPDAYRETLEQHLLHGAAPHEIAAATGLRPGTVRMRLRRGLAQLRRRLPQGLALGGAIAAMPASVHAAMRARVLRDAPVQAGAATGAANLIALTMMKKHAVGLVALLALLALTGVAWLAGDARSTAVDRTPAPRIVSTDTAEGPTPPESADATPAAASQLRTETPAPTETGRLVLRVVNAQSDAPVPHVRLALRWSNRKGTRVLTPDNGTVELDAPVGAASVTLDGNIRKERWTRKFTVRPGRQEEVLRIPAQFTLELRVVDAARRPVPHARIIGSTDSDRNLGWSDIGAADAEGRFTYSSVLHGISVAAQAEGRVRSAARYSSVRDDAHHRFELVVGGPAHTVTGTVFDASGRPVSGAYVAIYPPAGTPPQPPLVIVTDARGGFRSTNVPAGRCDVIASTGHPLGVLHGDGTPRRFGRTACTVPTATPQDVHLALGATVTGVAQGVRGTRVEDGVMVTTSVRAGFDEESLWGFAQEASMSVRPDDEGRYEIRGLMPGRYRLSMEDLQGPVVELRDGQVLRWDPPATTAPDLRVRLLDPQDRPLAAWTLMAHRAHFHTGPDGRARLARPDTEPVELRIATPEGGAAVHTVTLAPEPTEHTVRIPATRMPSARVTGRLVGAGVDLAQVEVVLVASDVERWSAPRVEVDARTGRFTSGLLMPGRYAIEVRRGRGPLGHAGVRRVDAGTTVDIGDIALAQPASLLIVANDAAGRRLRDVRVYLRAAGRDAFGAPPAEATADGVRIRGIPVGVAFDVLVTSPTTVPQWRRNVEPGAGEETRVVVTCPAGTPCVFALAAPGSSLRISLKGPDGPVAGATLHARHPELAQGLAPGRYELEVRGGAQVQRRSIDVPRASEPVRFGITPPKKD